MLHNIYSSVKLCSSENSIHQRNLKKILLRCSLSWASRFGNASCVTDVWNPIESRQFIGWWRDAAPDALTSSAYIGECAIYSSDFSAFMKWPYCPSVVIFWPNISDTDSPFALRRLHTAELCSPHGEGPWNIAVVNRRAHDDPHSKCVKCLGFSHAVIHFSPSRSGGLRGLSWIRDLGFGCWARGDGEWAERPRLFSPSLTGACAPVEFTHDYLYPSPGARDTVSFGLDDILLTAASDTEDFGPALANALPLSGQEARPSAAYSKLVDVLSRATEKLSLDWPDEPRESQAPKLDERFLSGPNSRPEWRKWPFFGDLHQEISRSWKQPFSSRLTNAAAAEFTNFVGSVEQSYTAMPVVKDTLASHLSPSLAPSWKSRPLLLTKPCRTTSALIGKSYIVAGQAGMALHTMAILQAYQADVLKEMDEGTGLTP